MVGQYIGWSLNNMMGIGLDLPKSFWKRLSNQNYEFGLVDLQEVDNYRYEMLKAI